MVYLRELPVALNDIDPVLLDAYYRFANTFTEDSIQEGYLKEHNTSDRSDDSKKDILRTLLAARGATNIERTIANSDLSVWQ